MLLVDMPTQYPILFGLPMIFLLIQDDGEREQITQLYLQYVGLMRKVTSRYFSFSFSEQEDAVSDVTLRICKNFSTISQMESHKIPSYIVKVCRSVCIDRIRKRSATQLQTSEEVLDNLSDEETSVDAIMSYNYALDLLASLPKLSDREKELIRMRHMDRMSFEEIGAVLNISEVSARSAVSRAKRRLQELAQQGDLEGYV